MTGLFPEMTEAEYRRAGGVNASFLKAGASSWCKAKYQHDNPEPPTPAQIIGTRVHQAVLEPNKPVDYAVKPDGMSFATKEGKAWRDANPVFVTYDDFQIIRGISRAVLTHPDAGKIVSLPGPRECTAFAVDPETGLQLKARFDLAPTGASFLVDLKTTACAQLHEWERDCGAFKYHVQASFYLKVAKLCGLPVTDFLFVAVEKDAPYITQVYQMGPESLAKGDAEVRRLLTEYKACADNNDWPAYFTGVRVFDIAKWALSDLPDQDATLVYELH